MGIMTSEPRAPQGPTSTSQVRVSSPTTSTSSAQPFNPQRSPLVSPAMPYPTYPSSTLHTYFPSPSSPQNPMHISTHTSSPPMHFSPVLLPSASQSCVPTIRGTPSPISLNPIDADIRHRTPLFVQVTSPLLSPLHFPQPFPLPFSSPILNNYNSNQTSTPHGSILFSPHHEPSPHTTNHFSPNRQNPLFLNSPATTESQHTAQFPISYENRRSPLNRPYPAYISKITQNFLDFIKPL
jgi:hypothetical protein